MSIPREARTAVWLPSPRLVTPLVAVAGLAAAPRLPGTPEHCVTAAGTAARFGLRLALVHWSARCTSGTEPGLALGSATGSLSGWAWLVLGVLAAVHALAAAAVLLMPGAVRRLGGLLRRAAIAVRVFVPRAVAVVRAVPRPVADGRVRGLVARAAMPCCGWRGPPLGSF